MDALAYDFVRNALAAGLLASVICGTVGSLVVVNRLVFLAGGVAHAAYGGVGLAFFMGWPVLPVTCAFSVACSLGMGAVALRSRERSDTFVGVLWAAGMAFGVILLDFTPGYKADLMSYLFGSILAVPLADLALMAGLTVLVLAVVLVCHRGFLVLSFDEEFARSRGVPATALTLILLALTALCVVMIIRVVGLILVIALMTIPPHMAERFSRSLAGMMVLASVLAAAFCVAGLWLSFALDITSGAAIIAVAAMSYFLSLALPVGRTPQRAA